MFKVHRIEIAIINVVTTKLQLKNIVLQIYFQYENKTKLI